MTNPFAMPESKPYASEWQADAELGSRFLAKIIDNVAMFAMFVPSVAIILVMGPENLERSETGPLLAMMPSMVLALGLVAYQWYLLSTEGQTVGKRAMGIRIVKMDGSPVDFVTAVILRTWIIGFVTGIANQLCLGWVVFLVDTLMIFGQERRCLHDQIAGTRVVEA